MQHPLRTQCPFASSVEVVIQLDVSDPILSRFD
jgi:hypothetical protein